MRVPGTEGRAGRVEGLIVALDGLVEAVPRRVDTAAFHQVTRAARAALDASDQAGLSDVQWAHVDSVLAAFVPDFARAYSTVEERRDMINEVVEALLVVHKRAASLVEAWQRTHCHELERRRQQERCRGLMRTVVRAWREEADGRKARSLRVAVPAGTLVEHGRHAGRLGSGDCLPTRRAEWQPPRDGLVAALGGDEQAMQRLRAERRAHERGDDDGAWLPVGQSAVPAGSLARLLLTYVRLVEGGRLRLRRQLCVRVAAVRRGQEVLAGRPVVEDWEARVRRTQLLAEREGVATPVVRGGDDRGARRVSRAVGLHGGWGPDEHVPVPAPVEEVSTDTEPRCWRHGWARRLLLAEDGAGVGLHLVCGGCEEHDLGSDSGDGSGGDCGVGGGGSSDSDDCCGVVGGSGGAGESIGAGIDPSRGAGGCKGEGFGGENGGDGVRSGGEGGGGDEDAGDDAVRRQLPRRREVLAFAGWGADGGELPYRRLYMHEGVVRPRALRAPRFDGWAMHGTPAEQVPTFSFVRRLDLMDAHPLEDDVDMPGQEVHARACEVQRGQGRGISCDRKSAAANVGMAHVAHDAGSLVGIKRAARAGLRVIRGAIRGTGRMVGRLWARERTGTADVQQQQQHELQHDGPMLVEQLEHGHDGGGERQRYAHEEPGSVGGGMGGESGATTSGDEAASGVLLRNAASFGRGHSSAGCGSSEGVLLVRGAGAGREDAVRLAGCEGSVSLAWRAGVG